MTSLVMAEHDNSELKGSTLNTVSAALKIDSEIHLLVAGSNCSAVAESASKIEGISNIRDESDRKGMRIVYILKRDAIPNIVLNKLFKHTSLQSSFSVNNIALVKGRPKLLNLKEMIVHFVDHRHEVVVRRTKYELKKAEDRAHILEGLIKQTNKINKIIIKNKA